VCVYCSDLTDAEFGLFLEAEERRVNHCQVVLDLLLQAQAAHLKEQQQYQQQQQGAPGRPVSMRGAADRMSARLAYLIAEQQVETHNLTAARKLLLQVVYTYRRYAAASAPAQLKVLVVQCTSLLIMVVWGASVPVTDWQACPCQLQAGVPVEHPSYADWAVLVCVCVCRDGWEALLLHSLLLLRDVCQRLKLHKESLLHSLEVASLAASLGANTAADAAAASGLFDHEQAQGLASASLLGLLAGPQDNKSSLKKSVVQQQPGSIQGEQPQQQQQHEDGLARTSAGASPRTSSSSWEYVVQQVDLAAALQQAPARQEDGTPRANQGAEVLLL
jgi:hypothetical protein